MKITLHEVCFSYNQETILQNINLEYDSKDFLCIVGPNGGGKSTILRLILGLLKATSGKILIDDKPASITNNFGFVPQNIPINKSFPISVLEVVMMGKLNSNSFGFYSKSDKLKALEQLEKVDMKDYAQAKIGSLSGGERQRVYIARALLGDPKIIILDEPTSSIDPKGSLKIYSLLKELNKSGIGVICVSHDMNLAFGFADKIAHVDTRLVLHENSIKTQLNAELLARNGEHFCDVELIDFLDRSSCCCLKH